jgi:hypothetical protein
MKKFSSPCPVAVVEDVPSRSFRAAFREASSRREGRLEAVEEKAKTAAYRVKAGRDAGPSPGRRRGRGNA